MLTFYVQNFLAVNRTMNLTDWYGQAPGARLNHNKTQAKFYRPWTVTETTRPPLTVSQTDMKILGVKFEWEGGRGWEEQLAWSDRES